MPVQRFRRRAWFATATICALGAGALVPLAALPAGAAEEPPHPSAYAAFDTAPVQSAGLFPTAVVRSLDVSATEVRYARGVVQTVTDPASGVVAVQTIGSDGALQSSVDLTSALDDIRGALVFNDWSAGRVLTAVVWGTENGEPVLVRAVGPDRSTLAGATVTTVTTPLIDPANLEALAEAGSGLMAVHRESDGGYVAQRMNYAMDSATGSEIVLDLPEAADRRFALDSSYGNIVSTRPGAVDVISRYSPATVHTVDVDDLGPAVSLDIANSTLAVADADGDVGVFSLEFDAPHTLLTTAHVDGGVSQVSVSDGLEEVLIVPADRQSIERIATDPGAGLLEPIDLTGASVVPGSLDSGSLVSGGVLLAEVGGSVYRYTTSLSRAASVFVWEGRQSVSISEVSTRSDAPSWSFAASGSGDLAAEWEYSLDGGEHWALRGTGWDSAVVDAGDVRGDIPPVAAPLDGVATAFRTEVSTQTLNNTSSFSRYESAVGLPAVGFDAEWRVRVSNALSSVASTPIRITVTDDTPAAGPAITRHPASATVAQSATAELRAEAAGTPAPAVQWETSRDAGATWTALAGQTSTTLALAGRLQDDGTLYRAVFTAASAASGASTTSTSSTTEAARLTVTGPPAQPLGAAPEGAVVATGGRLGYDLSAYAHEWLRATWGEGVTAADPQGFTFSDGTGWVHPESGAAQLQWKGAAIYLPYGGMNGLHVTLADPYLAVAPDGRGTITADVAWNNGGGMGGSGSSSESAGTKRVVIATFADSELAVDAAGATFSGTPEWEGRSYVKPGLGDATTYPSSFPASFLDWLDDGLRPWLYASGSSRDPEKAPSPVSASFTVTAELANTELEAIDPVEPLDAAPTVVQRPLSTTLGAGTTLTLTAEGTGRPAPTVRWQLEGPDGWADVAGATSTTLVVDDVVAGTYRYRAVFTNRAGEIATAAARVTVQAAPVPTAPPTPEPTVPPTPGPSPDPEVHVQRIAGADRYEVSVATSKAGFPDGASTVYVASGVVFPDALSAAPAATVAGAPILLTTPAGLPAGVAREITRLGASEIVIVGGTSTVSPAVEAALAELGTVTRIGGADRYEASRSIARAAFPTGAPLAVLSTGTTFADALSAGAAVDGEGPVILVKGSAPALDEATKGLLVELGVERIAIAGGEASVSAGIQAGAAAIAETTRLGGADRYEASRTITAAFFDSADHVVLATGAKYSDALSGSAFAPRLDAPLFAVRGDCVPAETLAAIEALGATEVTLLGGTATLSPAVERLEACAG